MRDYNDFTNFIIENNFSEEKINEVKQSLSLTDKQLIRESFKHLHYVLHYIKNNEFFDTVISNNVNLILQLFENKKFTDEEAIINRNRIKRTRELLLINANKYNNDTWLEAANKLDEAIIDKNIDVNDLKKLLLALIDKKEDVNIIKKFLKSNKAVILIENNELFEYVFNLALDSIKNNDSSIFYYISLLKILYSSKIDKTKYVRLLNSISDDTNQYANEIYYIIYGLRRSLKPEEVLDKYGIVIDLQKSNIILPNLNPINEAIYAVDSNHTIVRDDAFSIKKLGNKYLIGIHISDPAKSININDNILFQAINNYKNVYLSDTHTKIFHKDIEKQFSLDKKQPRYVISLYAELNDSGDIIDYYIKQNEIVVSQTFSYAECDSIINNNYSSLYKTFNELYYLSDALDNKNNKKKEYWDKKFQYRDSVQMEHKSDKIIREIMILYNSLIATLMSNENVPYIYRTQDESYFDELISELDINADNKLQKIIDSVYLVSKYSDSPSFHNGLKVPIYSHSSCPLRRFPDLYNEYLIHNYYFKDISFDFNEDKLKKLVEYFNQRNQELSLMRSEYNRALKLQKRN